MIRNLGSGDSDETVSLPSDGDLDLNCSFSLRILSVERFSNGRVVVLYFLLNGCASTSEFTKVPIVDDHVRKRAGLELKTDGTYWCDSRCYWSSYRSISVDGGCDLILCQCPESRLAA